MVGVRHLQPAVIRFELAGDQPAASFGQQPLEISRVGVEIDELERGARLVLDQHAIGPERPPRRCHRRRPMLGHGDFERGELADLGVGDAGASGRSITETGRCHTEVDDPRMRRPHGAARPACSADPRLAARRP